MKLEFYLLSTLLFVTQITISQKNNPNKAYQLMDRCYDLVNHYPDSVIIYTTEVIKFANQQNDNYLESIAYHHLGNGLRTIGEPEKSLIYLFKSLSLLTDSEKDNTKKPSVYSAIGNTYYQLGDINQAIVYYNRSYQLKIKLKKDFESAIVASQLVGMYAINNNPDSAFYLAKIAEPILIQHQASGYLANLYNAIGATYQMTNNLDSALHYYKKSVELFSKENLLIQLQPAYFNIGNVLYEQKKYTEALTYANKGLEIFSQYPNIQQEFLYYELLTNIYEKSGNYALALSYKKMQDSLQNTINQIKEKNAVYEMEEKFKLLESEKLLSEQEFELQKKNLDLALAKENFYRLTIVGVVVVFILLVIATWFWFKRKTQEKIEQAKEHFFSNVMHEIRTPLSLITGPVENLKGDLNDIEKNKNYELINRNANRLTALVNQLLDISKIDSNKFIINLKNGNLSVFIDEIVENFETLALSKGIELKLIQNNTNQIIVTDFDALEKIIANLVSNAIKYSFQNSVVTITVTLNSNQLTLGIKDEGIGISKADQHEIFTRFNRGKNANVSSGVGIGLSLVKNLVELMSGEITFNSKLNKGSYFEIKIPIRISTIETDLRKISEDAKLILLVEDDYDMQTFVKSVLEQEKFKVVCAENGKMALDILNDTLPDLILSDVMMPEMDGIEMVEEVRKNDLYSHIPIILLSAKQSSTTKIKGLEKGADLYLEKPFNPNELLLTVNNYINTINKAHEKFDLKIKKQISFEEKIHTEDQYLKKLNGEILKELDNADFSVEELADRLAISRSQLHRKVKSLTGKSISNYMRIIRLEKAFELLTNNAGNVTEIAYSTGFNSQSYFTKSFVDHFGFPPSEIQTRKK